MDEQLTSFASFVDERGTLVPIDLDHAGFGVRRVFAVAGPVGGSTRGNHAATCRELIVLVTGSVEVTTGLGAMERTVLLTRPGETAEVDPGEWIRYRLGDGRSVILVLADDTYCPPDPLP